jgi:hypothetical protein
MYSWEPWFCNQRSEGGGHPLLQCTCCTKYAAETKSAVYGSSGAMRQGRLWPPPPT